MIKTNRSGLGSHDQEAGRWLAIPLHLQPPWRGQPGWTVPQTRTIPDCTAHLSFHLWAIKTHHYRALCNWSVWRCCKRSSELWDRRGLDAFWRISQNIFGLPEFLTPKSWNYLRSISLLNSTHGNNRSNCLSSTTMHRSSNNPVPFSDSNIFLTWKWSCNHLYRSCGFQITFKLYFIFLISFLSYILRYFIFLNIFWSRETQKLFPGTKRLMWKAVDHTHSGWQWVFRSRGKTGFLKNAPRWRMWFNPSCIPGKI